MKTTITTTITTTLDIETLEPDHKVSIEVEDELPHQVIYAAVYGGARALMKTVAKEAGVTADDADSA